jgi:hypothetical protein
MPLEIVFIANYVFPKPALPDFRFPMARAR